MLLDEFLDRLHATVEIDRPDYRLIDVREHVGRQVPARLHAAAQEQIVPKRQVLAKASTGNPADHGRLYLRHFPFLILGESAIKLFHTDEAEDGIAQEFQPFE